MSYKLLVVDDEKDIVKLLKDFFEIQGYLVYTAYNGMDALEQMAKHPDLILLDINMPKLDGMEVCKRIRNFVSCPIIFLTAKVEEKDRINGLLVGGDDYVVKPFSLEELGARIKAHLRREERIGHKETIHFNGELAIQYTKRKLYYDDNEITLTKTEFDIVEFLSLHRGQIFSKESIYEHLWGFEKEGDSNIITEHIRRIRTKLATVSEHLYIETVWGIGYKWIG